MHVDPEGRHAWSGVNDWYPCGGGHVGFTRKLLGADVCTRCGDVLDMSSCFHGMAHAFCSKPWRHDHIRQSLVNQARSYGSDPRR